MKQIPYFQNSQIERKKKKSPLAEGSDFNKDSVGVVEESMHGWRAQREEN